MHHNASSLITHRDDPALLAAYALKLARMVFAQADEDEEVFDDLVSPLDELAAAATRGGIFGGEFRTKIMHLVISNQNDRRSDQSTLIELCTAVHRVVDLIEGRKIVAKISASS